jgi:prepilin-type N-terminal cleavage/methylation domain-containing protein
VIDVLRRRLRGLRPDDGFTLTELIVTMFILGIVLAAVQTTLIMTQKTVGEQATRVDQTQQTSAALNAVTKTLRTAVLPSQLNGTCSSCDLAAFIQGTPTSVSFYANINNDGNVIGPSRVSYNVNSSYELVESIQAPNAHAATDFNYQYCTPGTTGCIVKTRVLARHVVPGSAIFTYYDPNGVSLGTGTLSAADLANVDTMDVVISVDDSTASRVPPTTFMARVSMPNHDSVTTVSPSP